MEAQWLSMPPSVERKGAIPYREGKTTQGDRKSYLCGTDGALQLGSSRPKPLFLSTCLFCSRLAFTLYLSASLLAPKKMSSKRLSIQRSTPWVDLMISSLQSQKTLLLGYHIWSLPWATIYLNPRFPHGPNYYRFFHLLEYALHASIDLNVLFVFDTVQALLFRDNLSISPLKEIAFEKKIEEWKLLMGWILIRWIGEINQYPSLII